MLPKNSKRTTFSMLSPCLKVKKVSVFPIMHGFKHEGSDIQMRTDFM